MRGVELTGTGIHGEITGLTINGAGIGPLAEGELDRRYPGRAKMRPADPAGFGQARGHPRAALGPDRRPRPGPGTGAVARVS